MQFSGIVTALATPFRAGAVDESSLRKLVRFQLERGIQGLVINGTTAESPVLSADERQQIFQLVKSEVAGQVPLIMGTGSNCTRTTIELTQQAQALGAAAVLLVTPYYNKPPQRGLIAHFTAVAQATELPIILYNVPARTITAMTVETLQELSRHEKIIGVKEATGDVVFVDEVVRACGTKFLVTSGDDHTYLRAQARGARGVISVAAHLLPGRMRQWSERLAKGDESVHGEYAEHRALLDLLYVESNPIAVKYALHAMGIFASPELRLPLVSLDERYRAPLKAELERLGLLP